jgi:hypothetical protein
LVEIMLKSFIQTSVWYNTVKRVVLTNRAGSWVQRALGRARTLSPLIFLLANNNDTLENYNNNTIIIVSI